MDARFKTLYSYISTITQLYTLFYTVLERISFKYHPPLSINWFSQVGSFSPLFQKCLPIYFGNFVSDVVSVGVSECVDNRYKPGVRHFQALSFGHIPPFPWKPPPSIKPIYFTFYSFLVRCCGDFLNQWVRHYLFNISPIEDNANFIIIFLELILV